MYNLYAGFIGILIAIMVLVNGVLGTATGNYTSSVIIHIVGLICIIFILIVKKYKITFNKTIPLYFYCGGAIGIFVVLFNNVTFQNIGVSLTVALGLLGQSVASIIIDHYGLLGMKIDKFKKEKIVGLLLICIGVIIMTLF